jgi:predicted aspartyl protease
MATQQMEMGRVTVEATIENLQDLWDVERGLLPPDQVRRVVLPNALVDTGATLLSLPRRLIDQLGLREFIRKRVTTAGGEIEVGVFSSARLTVADRYCNVDVSEVPDNAPALIGQIPLEYMDLVVDCANRKLIGNPEHGGKWMFEMF